MNNDKDSSLGAWVFDVIVGFLVGYIVLRILMEIAMGALAGAGLISFDSLEQESTTGGVFGVIGGVTGVVLRRRQREKQGGKEKAPEKGAELPTDREPIYAPRAKFVSKYKTKTQDSEQLRCLRCGRRFNSDDSFCTNCGTPKFVEEEIDLVCAGCGTEVQKTDRFCKNCGRELGEVEITED